MMIKLFAWNVSPLYDADCYAVCYEKSSQVRRQKADGLKVQKDKARSIAAGLLLEYAYKNFNIVYQKELAKANSFGASLPEIETDENGKPYFVLSDGRECGIYFNLSHSGDYVLCGIGNAPIGVDVQKRHLPKESILDRFLTAEEKQVLEQRKDKELTFAGVWSKKEAMAKLTGRGLAQILDREYVEHGVCVFQGDLAGEYAWAVAACVREEEQVEPIVVEMGDIFNE